MDLRKVMSCLAAGCALSFAAFVVLLVLGVRYAPHGPVGIPERAPNGAPDAAPDAAPAKVPDKATLKKTLLLAPPPGATQKDVETCVAILGRRFAKAEIQALAEALPSGRIVVRVHDDPDSLRRAGALLAAGGHLEFKVVADPNTPRLDEEIARIRALRDRKAYDRAAEKYDALPFEPKPGTFHLVENAGSVEGHFIATASAHESPDRGWVVEFQMNPEGTDAFSQFTTRNQGRIEAVILDDVVKAEFYVQEPIRDGSALLSRAKPGFGRDEARAITALMTSGRLPIELSLEEGEPAEER